MTDGGYTKAEAWNLQLQAKTQRQEAALAMISAKLPVMPDPDAGPDEEIEIALTWREVSQIKHALLQKDVGK